MLKGCSLYTDCARFLFEGDFDAFYFCKRPDLYPVNPLIALLNLTLIGFLGTGLATFFVE